MKDHPMKFGSWLIAIAALLTVASTPALARHKVHHKHYQRVVSRSSDTIVCDQRGCHDLTTPREKRVERYETVSSDERVVGGRHAGDPHAFCGAEAARYVFGETKRDLWPAANWIAKFARAAPSPGMAAARSHHVMVLMSHVSGSDWLVHDGNSGHGLTREHVRSIAGYVIVDPHSPRYASR
jgi:hypothetical protein